MKKLALLLLLVLIIISYKIAAQQDSDMDGIADENDKYPYDFDNDGMPDIWEKRNGLFYDKNDANKDNDGDGYSNLEEYKMGTDPGSVSTDIKIDTVKELLTPVDYKPIIIGSVMLLLFVLISVGGVVYRMKMDTKKYAGVKQKKSARKRDSKRKSMQMPSEMQSMQMPSAIRPELPPMQMPVASQLPPMQMPAGVPTPMQQMASRAQMPIGQETVPSEPEATPEKQELLDSIAQLKQKIKDRKSVSEVKNHMEHLKKIVDIEKQKHDIFNKIKEINGHGR